MASAPTFQHRHYVLIASIIANLPEEQRELAAIRFAHALKGTNPMFNDVRFQEAAMGTPRGRDKVR